MVLYIIDIEGLIYEEIFVCRLVREYGFQWVGRQIWDWVKLVVEGKRNCIQEMVGSFYWFENNFKCYVWILNCDDDVKKFDFICVDELIVIFEFCGDKGQFVEFFQVLGIGWFMQQMWERLEVVICNQVEVSRYCLFGLSKLQSDM